MRHDDAQLAELEALLAKATPGPWLSDGNMVSTEDALFMGREEDIVGEDIVRDEDAALIAALRNAAPALLAAARELNAVRHALAAECTLNEEMARELKRVSEERDRYRIAITRSMGAFVDAETIVVPDEPAQLEAAIKALTAERNRYRDALTNVTIYDCSPDTMGQCGCCGIFRDIARAALSEKP
jgi:hypothetical protein